MIETIIAVTALALGLFVGWNLNTLQRVRKFRIFRMEARQILDQLAHYTREMEAAKKRGDKVAAAQWRLHMDAEADALLRMADFG